MRHSDHLDNLQTYLTPKERLSSFFWGALFLGITCAIAWDIGVYTIRFRESGSISQLVVVAFLALAGGWLVWLRAKARKHWYGVLAPILLALAGPFVLSALEG